MNREEAVLIGFHLPGPNISCKQLCFLCLVPIFVNIGIGKFAWSQYYLIQGRKLLVSIFRDVMVGGGINSMSLIS